MSFASRTFFYLLLKTATTYPGGIRSHDPYSTSSLDGRWRRYHQTTPPWQTKDTFVGRLGVMDICKHSHLGELSCFSSRCPWWWKRQQKTQASRLVLHLSLIGPSRRNVLHMFSQSIFVFIKLCNACSATECRHDQGCQICLCTTLYQNDSKYTKWRLNIPNGHKI
jgi:hypothetical protein